MINFTKEELQLIHDDANNAIEMSGHDSDQVYAFRDKVKRMIDNYCDHEWKNYCCGCSMSNIYCEECERSLDELP